MSRRRRRAAACLALLLALLAAPSAQAAYDPVASGSTALVLNKQFLELLRTHEVEISTREGASFQNGSLRFPVSGGKFDPGTKNGTVEHDGTALFRRGNRALSLKGLQLKTTRRSSPFVARLGGGQLKLGPAKRMAVSRRGFGEKVLVADVRLSAKVATRLSKRLRLRDVFEEGMLVGSLVTVVNPETVTINGGGIVNFEFDPGMAAKLDELHVAVSPIFPAEHRGPFTFPIFNGKLAPNAAGGYLQLEGALELLQLGGGQVIWREPKLDLDGGTFAPRELEAVAALDLGAGATAVDPKKRTLSVTALPLELIEPTAALFNDAFAKSQNKQGVFSAGEVIGRISFVAEAQ
jgi:hypothetical protein